MNKNEYCSRSRDVLVLVLATKLQSSKHLVEGSSMIFRYLSGLLLFFLAISTSSHLPCSLPLYCLTILQVKWGPKRDGYALMMTAHHVSWLGRSGAWLFQDQPSV